MKRMITIAFMMTVVVMMAHAQGALKRVYNETIDPMTQIDEGLQKAKAEGKFVICQVGGNWCPWCLRFADFVEKNTAVNKAVNDNFVYLHVNYNPRKKEGDASVEIELSSAFRFPCLRGSGREWQCSPYPGFQLPGAG